MKILNAQSNDQQKLAVRSMLQSKDLTRRVKTVCGTSTASARCSCLSGISQDATSPASLPYFLQQLESDLAGNVLSLGQLKSRCDALEGATKDITSLMLAMQSMHGWGLLVVGYGY